MLVPVGTARKNLAFHPASRWSKSLHCLASHRVEIVLAELKLPHEVEIVDVSKPRSAYYLTVNPRGLVPALTFNGENFAESAIIAQFLVDAHPQNTLIPAPTGPKTAIPRARILFFVDTFMQFVYPVYARLIKARSADAEEAGKDAVAAVVKNVEPLLVDAAPFFGGSETLTMAEVS
jgi:glutathione S-transferase